MPVPFSQIALQTVAAVLLLNCGTAYAADNAAAAAPTNFASVPEEAAPMATTIVVVNNRETNLRKNATKIVVLGLHDGKSRRNQR